MDTNINTENIYFFLEDKNEYQNNEIDFTNLIREFEKKSIDINLDLDKETNDLSRYNITELNKICEYYGLLKNIKMAKYKKIEIINAIQYFEEDELNSQIVEKRKKLWANVHELLEDKIMRKYIIWK
jgi:hypothetical protein